MEYLIESNGQSEPANGSIGQVAYWERISGVAKQVVTILDEKESWVIEGHPHFAALIGELVDLVQSHPKFIEFIEDRPVEAFKLMAYLHSSTAMMLLHIDDQNRPEVVERFLSVVTALFDSDVQGEVSVVTGLALDRFLAFERAGLLSRIFSEERVEGVLRALERAGASASRRRTNDGGSR